MNTYDPVNEIRFYLRHCWRLGRSGRDPLTLPSGDALPSGNDRLNAGG
jgi:hypothetical protein